MKKLLILIATLPLIACGDATGDIEPVKQAAQGSEEAQALEEAQAPEDAQKAPTSRAGVDFGTDSSEWANDDECDDPRFEGRGMTATPLLDEDIKADATDCRAAFERGELTLIE